MDPFIGQIMMFGFNFPPRGWAECDGQLLQISTYSALFSLLGTQYGGDGRTTFGLPDLRGRFAMHNGSGPGLTSRNIGQKFGAQSHQLLLNQLAPHTHGVAVPASSAEGETGQPGNAVLAAGEFPALPYGPTPDTALQSFASQSAGSSQSVDHMNPALVINFCIALQGIYPSRN
jgi:microcystin-dependent protein